MSAEVPHLCQDLQRQSGAAQRPLEGGLPGRRQAQPPEAGDPGPGVRPEGPLQDVQRRGPQAGLAHSGDETRGRRTRRFAVFPDPLQRASPQRLDPDIAAAADQDLEDVGPALRGPRVQLLPLSVRSHVFRSQA